MSTTDTPYRPSPPPAPTRHTPALACDHALTLSVTEPFTLADLRRVYEAVWGNAPDLANFRRKVLNTPGFVVATNEHRAAASERGGAPPLLYHRGTAQWINPPFSRDRA